MLYETVVDLHLLWMLMKMMMMVVGKKWDAEVVVVVGVERRFDFVESVNV